MKSFVRRLLISSTMLVLSIPVFAQQAPADTLKEIQRQIEILTQEIENLRLGEVSETIYEPSRGLGPAAAKVYQLKKTGVSIAGYGELVYENYDRKREDGVDANKRDKFDYLRNIVYVGFRFNDWIIFNSEIEFEHAHTGKGGVVSMEFGYIDLMFSRHFNVRAGMVLPPLGIVNEKHEPSTFFGSLRPQVERQIIPSTWRANGIGIYGELFPSLDYRAYLIEGLNAASFSDADGIRNGRQNGANSIVENFGLAGKLEYKGIAGAIAGVSFFTGKSGQEATDAQGVIEAATTVLSFHGEYAWQGIELRALYAQVSLDEANRVSALTGKTIGSKMTGWYAVAGYDLMPLLSPGSSHYLAPFVQYEQFNTHAEVAAGYTANPAHDRTIMKLGLSYKPHPNVAFKFDYNDNTNKAKTGVPQWNLAVTYLF
ncbi:MAG: hypothetical protein WD182_00120 [Bacteroidota bacterium]